MSRRFYNKPIIKKFRLTWIFNNKNIYKNVGDQLKKSKTFLEKIEKVLFLLSFGLHAYFCFYWKDVIYISNMVRSTFLFSSSSSCCFTNTDFSIDSNSSSTYSISSLSSILTSLFRIILFSRSAISCEKSMWRSEFLVS